MREIDFINAVLAEADCDLLLDVDVNNIHVNAVNHGYDANAFLDALPGARIAYVHIAGHYVEAPDLLVDTHGAAIVDPVWQLLARAYRNFGVRPTLVERDFNFSPIGELIAEVATIRRLQAEHAEPMRHVHHAEPPSASALQTAFAAHIRDPQHAPCPADVEPRRMAVYTELFFNNIENLLAANFPVIRTLYADAAWRDLVRDFYREHRSQTPLFTEIAREFIRRLEYRSEHGSGDPAFLAELAHYEWSELALSIDEHDIADIAHDSAGDVLIGVPVVSPLAHVLAYRFPLHQIGSNFRPDVSGVQPTLILLTRDRRYEVHFLEIDALTALLIERLQANQDRSGQACLDTLLAELGRDDDAALRVSGTASLQRLRERDAILGTRS